MKYIVYFDDTHVDILDEEDIMLMDYEDYSIEDWSSLSLSRKFNDKVCSFIICLEVDLINAHLYSHWTTSPVEPILMPLQPYWLTTGY